MAEPAQEKRQDACLLEHCREQASSMMAESCNGTSCILGQINSSQAAAWRKAIEVFEESTGDARTLALFPEDRCAVELQDASIVKLRLSEMRLCRPRQYGACWLAGSLWQELRLGRFWAKPDGVTGGGRAPVAEPQGRALGMDPSGPSDISADRAEQRMASAS